MISVIPSCDPSRMAVEATFDHRHLLDELRCRPTEWLWARRDDLVREQRRLHAEELAVTAVLDERRALDDSVAARDGVSLRSVQEKVETAEDRLWQLREELLSWVRPAWAPSATFTADWFSDEDSIYDDLSEPASP